MALTLGQRIFWWSAVSTLIVLLAVFLVVDRTFRNTILSDLEQRLDANLQLASELNGFEREEFQDRVQNLALEPTLRAAVETLDEATVRQNLDRLLGGSRLDWLAVTTPDGDLVAATPSAPLPRLTRSEALVQEARDFDTGDLWRDPDGLMEVHASALYFGRLQLGVLLGGSRVGAQRVNRLATGTQQQVAIVSDGRLLAADSLTSARGGGELALSAEGFSELQLGGEPYLAAARALPDATGGPVGSLVVLSSLEEALRPVGQLRFVLLGIAGGGVLLAFVFSLVLSRSVTRPVNRLLEETVRLGSGDLRHPVVAERADEIGKLAEGFDRMRVSLHRVRENLIRAERLSAVGQAVSAVVHDFRQPLTVIKVHVDLLAEDGEDEESRREDLEMVSREIDRLGKMMNEMLEFARGGDRIEPTRNDVPAFLERLERSFRPSLEDQGTSLEVEHGYEGEWTLDFGRTTRVVENLVRNAAGALGSGGTIRLASSLEEDRLRIMVADDGPGVPEELRASLFEPFVTQGKVGGTGLGLATAKALTERQGGRIWFDASDRGTTFHLEFPPGLEGEEGAA